MWWNLGFEDNAFQSYLTTAMFLRPLFYSAKQKIKCLGDILENQAEVFNTFSPVETAHKCAKQRVVTHF